MTQAAKYANVSGVPLSLAIFLAHDTYDHNKEPNTISVTTLMKPLRQIILPNRVPAGEGLVDLISMVSSRIGTAIHDGIERAWLHGYVPAMQALGYPQKVIDRVRINPKPEELTEDTIPVYQEVRSFKKVGRWTVSGKFDFVFDGGVEDFKTTGVYSYTSGSKDDDYIYQGSTYRWLNPEIITKDQMKIQFIFTDWSSMQAKQAPTTYPQQRIMERVYPLKPIQEMDTLIRRKLDLIDTYWEAEEKDIPFCTDEELWRSEPVFKYYKGDPATAKRSTKNFDTQVAASTHLALMGVGTVIEKPGTVRACLYCPAFAVCSQKDGLIASGDLEV